MTILAGAAALAGLMAAGSANAAVTYIFQGESFSGAAGFQLTVPTYISGTRSFAAGALDSCTPAPGFICNTVFLASTGALNDTVSMNFTSTAFNWFFPGGSEGHDGVYQTTFGAGAGTLTVRSTTAVPEPSAWALMIAGFGLAGAALRRRPKLSRNPAAA
jgi:hypothetical protein